jgi:hypothetical protein
LASLVSGSSSRHAVSTERTAPLTGILMRRAVLVRRAAQCAPSAPGVCGGPDGLGTKRVVITPTSERGWVSKWGSAGT